MQSNTVFKKTVFYGSIFLIVLICLIPWLYLVAGLIIPIPYGILMTVITVVFLLLSCKYRNIFNIEAKKYLSTITVGSTITAFILIALIFMLVIVVLDSHRDFAFKAAILGISILCAVLSAVYGGAIKNEPLVINGDNILFKILAIFFNRIPFKMVLMLLTFAFSSIVWIILSYGSYYNGVEVGAKQAGSIVVEEVSSIINSDIENIDKKIKINEFLRTVNKRAQIQIEKNEKLFAESYSASAVRPGYDLSKNVLEELPKSKEEKKLQEKLRDKDNNQYSVQYRFPNRPFLADGLGRAISFSIFDTNNKIYFDKALYLRSMHLWWVFWLLYSLSLYCYYFYQGKEEALLEKEEAFAELEDYKIFFDDIRKHIDDQISESRNTLQLADSSWSKIAQDANQAVLDGYQNKRHDTFNYLMGKLKGWGKEDYIREFDTPEYKQRLNSYMDDIQAIDQTYYAEKGIGKSFLAETYDVVLNTWLLRIRQDLKNLDDIFDLTPTNIAVGKIVQGLTSEKTLKKIKCHVHLEGGLNREAECCIIPDKLQSMVYNLLENSTQAGDRYKESLRKIDRKLSRSFRPEINLNINEIEVDGKKYLSIMVQDNCGGFPEELESKIYVDKVKSSKATNIDHGNGTYLIGRFAKRMGIIVQHETITLDGNQKGAQTKLLIPYI